MKTYLVKTPTIVLALLSLCTAVSPLTSPRITLGAPKPNIVFIFIDDMGYGDIGPFGPTVNETPNLDRMAAEGNILRQFYVSNTACTPSRSALMTGTYAHRIGMDGAVLFPGETRGLNPDELTIAELLKANGYATGCFGKWHLGDQSAFMPLAHGFDEYFGIPYSNDMWPGNERGHRYTKQPYTPLPIIRQNEAVAYVSDGADQSLLCEVVTNEAVRFIGKHRKEPFFVYLPHAYVHNPRYARPEHFEKAGGNVDRSAVEEVDTSVGRVLDTVRELGLAENTLVIFTSDNGGAGGMSMGPLRGGKGGAKYEGHMREPTISWWPGTIPAGNVTEEIVATIDILPSLARLVGAELPRSRIIDGEDALDVLLGKPGANSPHEILYYEVDGIRQGKWKLVKGARGKNELYDLEADLGETTNLAARHPDVVVNLENLLEKHAAEIAANQRPPGRVAEAKPIIDSPGNLPKLREWMGLKDFEVAGRSQGPQKKASEEAAAAQASKNLANYTPAPDDLLIADFEGGTYGEWTATGTAFGDGPVRANLTPPPNKVVGHKGEGLVNTYLGRDKSVGTLTSPPFKIERKHINFLIGGGNHADRTCINLVIGGATVRSAVGHAVKDNRGREILSWKSWDVAELAGREARIQIVDNHSGGWGHINIDHIFQSSTPLVSLIELTNASRAAQTAPQRVASKVPQYTFAETLEEQEEQLKTNPLLLRMHASRAAMADDPHRPIYHYVNPEGRLNDPNGLCFWQGRWHLFYQAYPPEDPRQHWGHAVSDDLIHWRDLPLAIYPDPEEKCFSGTCYVEKDRVIAIYHGIGTGTMVAVSSDPLLLNWEKVTGQAVIPFAKPGDAPLPYNIFDPCLWKKGDHYYALTAGQLPDGPSGKPVRAEFLHRSKDLAHWEYLHPFLENDQYGLVGDDGACPYFWPIGDQGKHILLHFSHMSGGKYLLGDYDVVRQKFVVTDGGDFNHGPVNPGGVHAPSAFPDGKGGIIAIFNMNPGMNTKGWNQIMTLPRRLTLSEQGKLNIGPAGDYTSLRLDHQRVEPQILPANEEIIFEHVQGNAMELVAEIDPGSSSLIELNVLRSPNEEEVTRILFNPRGGYRLREGLRVLRRTWQEHNAVTIDTSRSTTLPNVRTRIPETAHVRTGQGSTTKLHVFIDKSVVEVFVDGQQCAAVRVYPGLKQSVGVSLRAQGGDAELRSLDAWQVKNIYQ